MKLKKSFNECYKSVTDKLLLMIILWIFINIILSFFYRLNVCEKDLLAATLFFGNIIFLVYLFLQIRIFYHIIKIKIYLSSSGLFYKIGKIEYWNNFDTIFTGIGIIMFQKGNVKYINYRNIRKIKCQEINKANSLRYHSCIIGGVRYDYLVIMLKNNEEYRIKIEVYPEGTRCKSYIIINQLIPFILDKNQDILLDSTEKHSVYESIF